MITLVFDEGPGVGLGHRRRMEYLASALTTAAVELRASSLETLVRSDVIVVDSYLTRADDAERYDARALVAIEDLGRDLDVDLLVDLDPGATASPFTRARRLLIGPQYALVDPALASAAVSPVGDRVQRILVTTGAADAAGHGAALATALADALDDIEIALVVGPWGTDTGDRRVRVVRSPDGLGEELTRADVVVTAGGVTMLESCCLGRPTVAVSLADNQLRAVDGAAEANAVVATDLSHAASLTVALVHDADRRRNLSERARSLVDGQGATRVAAAVATISSHGTHAR